MRGGLFGFWLSLICLLDSYYSSRFFFFKSCLESSNMTNLDISTVIDMWRAMVFFVVVFYIFVALVFLAINRLFLGTIMGGVVVVQNILAGGMPGVCARV